MRKRWPEMESVRWRRSPPAARWPMIHRWPVHPGGIDHQEQGCRQPCADWPHWRWWKQRPPCRRARRRVGPAVAGEERPEETEKSASNGISRRWRWLAGSRISPAVAGKEGRAGRQDSMAIGASRRCEQKCPRAAVIKSSRNVECSKTGHHCRK